MNTVAKLPTGEMIERYVCIPLRGKRGGVALVSESAIALVEGYFWYMAKTGYAFSPKAGLMHRRSTAAEPGEHVDHFNFNKLDNRDCNLQCCTPQINQMRMKRRPRSPWPFKGVRKQFGRWYSRIAGKHIGAFDTAEEAARAYDEAARILFKHHAICNFGDQR